MSLTRQYIRENKAISEHELVKQEPDMAIYKANLTISELYQSQVFQPDVAISQFDVAISEPGVAISGPDVGIIKEPEPDVGITRAWCSHIRA